MTTESIYEQIYFKVNFNNFYVLLYCVPFRDITSTRIHNIIINTLQISYYSMQYKLLLLFDSY